MRDDKLMMFSKYLSLGKGGKMETFEQKLSKLGINYSLLRYERISSHFYNNPLLCVNFENQIKDIATKIGFAMSKGGVWHIPVVGYSKSGKTLFAKLIEFLSNEQGLKAKYFNAGEFLEEEEEETVYEKILNNSKEYDIIIIDDIWKDSDSVGEIKEIMKSMGRGALISIWNSFVYIEIEDDLIRNVEKTLAVIELNPLNGEMCKPIFEEIWNVISEGEGKKRELKNVFCLIFEDSLGFTGIAIRLFIDILKKFCMQDEENLEEFTKNVLERYGFKKIEKIGFDPLKLKILEIILKSRDSRGVIPSDIAREIKKDSATVTYHLSKLKSDGLLIDLRFGKNIFYRVKDIYAPLLEKIIVEHKKLLEGGV